MKRYFKCSIIVLLILVRIKSVEAQSDSRYNKFLFKTNALQWIMNEPNIGFEYRSSQKSGIETTVGIYGLYQISDYTIPSFPPFMPYKGFTLRVNPKFYLSTEAKLNGKAVYLSPMLLLRNVWIRDYTRGDYSINRYDKKRVVVGLSLLAGYQAVKGKHFLID